MVAVLRLSPAARAKHVVSLKCTNIGYCRGSSRLCKHCCKMKQPLPVAQPWGHRIPTAPAGSTLSPSSLAPPRALPLLVSSTACPRCPRRPSTARSPARAAGVDPRGRRPHRHRNNDGGARAPDPATARQGGGRAPRPTSQSSSFLGLLAAGARASSSLPGLTARSGRGGDIGAGRPPWRARQSRGEGRRWSTGAEERRPRRRRCAPRLLPRRADPTRHAAPLRSSPSLQRPRGPRPVVREADPGPATASPSPTSPSAPCLELGPATPLLSRRRRRPPFLVSDLTRESTVARRCPRGALYRWKPSSFA
jgi:hypothetical protein